jgi:hypothetical protein
MKTPRHLVITGASPQDIAEFTAFLRVLRPQLDHDWSLADDASAADAVFADLRDFGGRCARIRALDEGRHLVVLAEPGEDTLGVELVLLRPIVPKALVGLLNHVGSTTPPQPRRLIDFSVHERDIGKRTRTKTLARRDDARDDDDTRANFLDIQYERPCTPLDALLKRGALLIRRAGLPPLLVDPVTDLFHSAARMCELEPYFLDPLEGHEYQRIGGTQLAAMQNEHAGRPLVRLRWLNAFLRSNGYLARHLDPGAHYRLKQWLPLDNDYRKQHRIALTLMREAPLHIIARQAKAKMADVFDVVNAYAAMGLIETSRKPSSSDVAQALARAGGRAPRKVRQLLATTMLTR